MIGIVRSILHPLKHIAFIHGIRITIIVVNDYDKQTIIMAVKKEMDSRGYQLVKKNGDLVVSTFVVTK